MEKEQICLAALYLSVEEWKKTTQRRLKCTLSEVREPREFCKKVSIIPREHFTLLESSVDLRVTLARPQ